MKMSESEFNNLAISFSLKSVHEQEKELKGYAAIVTQLKKDLGEVEAELTVLRDKYYEARHNVSDQQDIDNQIVAKQDKKQAIRDEIEQNGITISKLSDYHEEKKIIKALKSNRRFSLKAVLEMIKATS